MCVKLCVSHRVTFAGLELEVVCFVKHWVLLHEQLLVELLYYLTGRQKERVVIQGSFMSVSCCENSQYWNLLKPQRIYTNRCLCSPVEEWTTKVLQLLFKHTVGECFIFTHRFNSLCISFNAIHVKLVNWARRIVKFLQTKCTSV